MITSAVATLVLTPALISSSRWLSSSAVTRRIGRFSRQHSNLAELEKQSSGLKDHVVICGFGVNGMNVAKLLKANDIPHMVLDLNPQIVKQGRMEGVPIFFGDCTDSNILEHAGIRFARVIVIAISDSFGAKRAVRFSRGLNPEIQILVRTKRISEIDEMYDAGADEVIPEEFEASIEVMTRILRIFNFPRGLIADEIKRIREDRYGIFRSSKATVPRLRLSSNLDVFAETVTLPEGSLLAGCKIMEIQIRRQTGVLILGIIRGGQSFNNPSAEEILIEGDSLILSGTKPQLRSAIELIRSSSAPIYPDAEQ